MHSSLRAIALGVALAITGSAATVSLSSFTPRIDTIPSSQCQSAYNTIISGCGPSDFGPGATCSRACLVGLEELTAVVQSSCNNVDVGSTSIIGVFQAGQGILSLCGVDSSSALTSPTTTTSSASTAQTSTPSTPSTPSTTLTTLTSTTTATRDAQSSRGLTIDHSPTGAVPAPPTPSAALHKPPPPPQLSNQGSGGGSPFDVQTAGSSRRTFSTVLAAVAGSALLLLACA
ncbi:hypothetical protein ACEQ8H_002198 [Pleosporales sp. CAS-2024a]